MLMQKCCHDMDIIAWLLEHPLSAGRMGRRGRAAIETRFTHRNEIHKLLNFYTRLTTNA